MEQDKEVAFIEKFESEHLIKWFGGKKAFIMRFSVGQDVNVKALFLGLLFFLVSLVAKPFYKTEFIIVTKLLVFIVLNLSFSELLVCKFVIQVLYF